MHTVRHANRHPHIFMGGKRLANTDLNYKRRTLIHKNLRCTQKKKRADKKQQLLTPPTPKLKINKFAHHTPAKAEVV